MCGEYTKLKKHLEWALDKSMSEVLKKNAQTRSEAGKEMQEMMNQLFEAMDKLQENMQKIASRIEQAPVGHEKAMDYGPPLPPTGHLGPPPLAPMTPMTPMSPAPTMSMSTGGLPPPPVVPSSVHATYGDTTVCDTTTADTSSGDIRRLQPCQNWRTTHDPCGTSRDDRDQESTTLSGY